VSVGGETLEVVDDDDDDDFNTHDTIVENMEKESARNNIGSSISRTASYMVEASVDLSILQ
jgi:hypothetical protein